MNKLAIEARNLKKSYGDITAVKGIDLSVAQNSIYALLGPNGAGKTTTISMLTTLTRPSDGQVKVAGYDAIRQPDQVRRRIGVTFQETVLDDALTGRQVMTYHGRLYGMNKAQRQAKTDELLALVELEEAADRAVRTYSGGMKRRLELARGLMTDPEILFLDEPTVGLDPQNRAKIWDYIRDLKQRNGLTLLLTTHYMDEAQQLADCVGIMDDGRIVVQGSPNELIDQMGDDAITLSGDGNRDDFFAQLKELPFIQDVTLAGEKAQIAVDSGNRRLVDVVTLANNNNFIIADIAVAKPSLADVFLKYTGRELRDR
jgi:ABC-2 type transport system ATP-binding protein